MTDIIHLTNRSIECLTNRPICMKNTEFCQTNHCDILLTILVVPFTQIVAKQFRPNHADFRVRCKVLWRWWLIVVDVLSLNKKVWWCVSNSHDGQRVWLIAVLSSYRLILIPLTDWWIDWLINQKHDQQGETVNNAEKRQCNQHNQIRPGRISLLFNCIATSLFRSYNAEWINHYNCSQTINNAISLSTHVRCELKSPRWSTRFTTALGACALCPIVHFLSSDLRNLSLILSLFSCFDRSIVRPFDRALLETQKRHL